MTNIGTNVTVVGTIPLLKDQLVLAGDQVQFALPQANLMATLTEGIISGRLPWGMIIAGMVFLSTTKIEEISQGLVKLGLPYRGAFAFSTAIRLVPLIVATSTTIAQAQKSRGLDLDAGSFLEKIRKHVPLVIPTLVSVIRSTNVFSMALESRGFGYAPRRTNLVELRMGRGDHLALALALALAALGAFIKIFPQALGPWGALFS